MKRIGTLIAVGTTILVAAIVYAGAPIGVQVGTNSVTVLPPRVNKGAAWANPSTNTIGRLIQNGSRVYLVTETTAFTDGTYAPTHVEGVVSNLLAIPSGKRRGFGVVNNSTNDVWLSISADAEVNKGILLKASGGSWTGDSIQERITAIAGSDSNLVTGVEW